jgi:type I restriction enzyme M protein
MFMQSVELIRLSACGHAQAGTHASGNGNGNGGRARADISIYGQESNYTTWRLAKMTISPGAKWDSSAGPVGAAARDGRRSLAIRGIEGRIAHGDTFHNDRFPDLKADFILALVEFLDSDSHRVRYQRYPFQHEPNFGVTNINYDFAELLARVEDPS